MGEAIIFREHFPTELEPDDDARKGFEGVGLDPFFA